MLRSLTMTVFAALLVASGCTAGEAPLTTADKITFTMPADGYVSLIIKDANGLVVRQLLNSQPMTQGKQTVIWDVAQMSSWMSKRKANGQPGRAVEILGEAVMPGEYTWSAIWHKGIGLRLRGWAYHGPSDPWDNGPKNYWGGDQALPISAASDGEKVYLGWAGSEAGKALIALDANDQVIWAAGYHFNSAGMVAVDAGIVYYAGGSALKRVDAKTGKSIRWPGQRGGSLPIKGLWKDPNGMPTNLSWKDGGLEAHGGKVYLTFSQWTWNTGHILDWKKFLTKIDADKDSGKGSAGAVAKILWAGLDEKCQKRVGQFLAGKIDQKRALGRVTWGVASVSDRIMRALRGALGNRDLVSGAADLSDLQLAKANRRLIEKVYGDIIMKAYSSFVVVLDPKTGKVLKRLDAEGPTRMSARTRARLAACSRPTSPSTTSPWATARSTFR